MFSQSPSTVLVVDDDEQVLRLVSMVLARAGYAYVTALTGAQGLVRFRAESPAVVITDLNMPVPTNRRGSAAKRWALATSTRETRQ